MLAYQVVNLGQDAPAPDTPPAEPVSVDREFAQITLEAIAYLEETEDRPEIRKEACWRSVMVVHGAEVEQLREKLKAFVASPTESLPLAPKEYAVVNAALDCVDTIATEEEQETELHIGRVATLIGIVGGVAALLTLS